MKKSETKHKIKEENRFFYFVSLIDDTEEKTKEILFNMKTEKTMNEFNKLFIVLTKTFNPSKNKDQNKLEAEINAIAILLNYFEIKDTQKYQGDISLEKINSLTSTIFFMNILIAIFKIQIRFDKTMVDYIKEIFLKVNNINFLEKQDSNNLIFNIHKK